MSGKLSVAQNAITYSAFKQRESQKRKSCKVQINKGAKSRKLSVKVKGGTGYQALGTGNAIKLEVSDYKLGL